MNDIVERLRFDADETDDERGCGFKELADMEREAADEIERLRQQKADLLAIIRAYERSTFGNPAAEEAIEQLTKQLQDTVVDADIIQHERLKAEAEVERLRGLLREAHLALSFMPDPTRKLLDLRYRVREALGE